LLRSVFELVRREKVASSIVALLIVVASALVVFSLNQPEPPSFSLTPEAVITDSATGTRRLTVDASSPNVWRFVSLRDGRVLEKPGPLDWDLALRRFHIATNGGPGFHGVGAAAVADSAGQPPALQQTSADTTKSGFGKWYDYGFASHLLTPKAVTYAVQGADGARYALRILSYYCAGAQPGCVTLEYR
jgi:hypothetical protein